LRTAKGINPVFGSFSGAALGLAGSDLLADVTVSVFFVDVFFFSSALASLPFLSGEFFPALAEEPLVDGWLRVF
jgi:hypothetical protein